MTALLGLKLRRDLAAIRGRVLLMAATVAVSLTVFGAVLYTATIVDREFDRGYLDTDPASATLVLEPGLALDRAAELAAAVATRPGVTGAAARTQLTTQFAPRPSGSAAGGPWADTPLQLFVAAPDDPRRPARFDIDQGSWPPPPDGILVERAAMTVLGVAVGDRISVRAPGGTPATLTVTGIAHDPSLADARQERKGYGFVSTAALPLLGRPAVLDQLKITTTDRADRDAVVGVARDVADWAADTGATVTEIQVPEPGQQPHRRWVDLILRVLLTFGSTSVLLSALLTATMLSRLLGRQIPQIAIMKAIGARTGPIVVLYLSMASVVTATATAAAVVPGLLLGRALARAVLAMYDMDATSLAVPWWTWTAVVAAGLLLAPLMALVPVLRASRTTVRQAMDHHGAVTAAVVAGAGTGFLQRAVGRIRGLDPALVIGLRNTVRRRTRFVLVVAMLAVAGGLFVGGAGALGGLSAFQEQALAQQRWDAEVDLGDFAPAGTAAAAVAGLPGVTTVETWSVVPVARGGGNTGPDGGEVGDEVGVGVEVTSTYPDQGHGTRFLAAVPPATSLLRLPLTAGRWLRPGDTDAVVLNVGGQGGMVPGTRVGDTVALRFDGRVTDWRVVGLVGQKFAGPAAFVSTAGFAAATGRDGQVNRVEIATADHGPDARSAVADQALLALSGAGIDAASAMPVERLAAVVDGHVYVAGYALLLIAVGMAVVGCVGMASTLSTGVLERTREFGVMHAIGASPSAVRRIVVAEGLFTGITGLVAGLPLAVAVAAGLNLMVGRMIGGGEPLPLRLSPPALLVWAAVVLIGAVAATLPPAGRASRVTVREALGYL